MRRIFPAFFTIAIITLCADTWALHFIGYGDTRSSATTHQQIVDAFAKVNPELVVHSGDLWDGYSASQFKSILTKNSNIAALLNANKFLVARGNHEDESAVLAFSPSIVRDHSIRYSFTEGNTYFVCIGYDPSQNTAWLEQQLSSTASRNARWRVIYGHVPVYSSGEHGASGVTAFEALCDKYKVTLYISGHDHIYERTWPIVEKKVTTKTAPFASTAGTIYIVTGGGGAPLYDVGSNWWTATKISTNHWCDIDAADDHLTLTAKKIDGSVIDQFTIKTPTTEIVNPIQTPAPATGDSLDTDETNQGNCGTGALLALIPPLTISTAGALRRKKSKKS